jgi:hypothetical protein
MNLVQWLPCQPIPFKKARPVPAVKRSYLICRHMIAISIRSLPDLAETRGSREENKDQKPAKRRLNEIGEAVPETRHRSALVPSENCGWRSPRVAAVRLETP